MWYLIPMAPRKDVRRGHVQVPSSIPTALSKLTLRIFKDSQEILKNSQNLRRE